MVDGPLDPASQEGTSDDDMLPMQPAKRKKRMPQAEVINFTELEAAGFDGGPSLLEASRAIGKAREEREAEERAAVSAAALKLRLEEEAEQAARAKRKQKRLQTPADTPQSERVLTQGDRRGAALRAQAAAERGFKQQAGEVPAVSLYAGALRKEKSAEAAARAEMAGRVKRVVARQQLR